MNKSYKNKLNLSGTEKDALYSLEELNLEDWKDFLKDLAFSKSDVELLFNLRLGEDPQIPTEILFENLGTSPRKLLLKAIEEVFLESLHLAKTDLSHQNAIFTYFSIVESLGEGIRKTDLERIMLDDGFSQDFRVYASEILLSLKLPPSLKFWAGISLDQYPFFTISVLRAYAEKSPIEALTMLRVIPNELLSDIESLEYPIEIALENLQAASKLQGLDEIKNLVKGLAPEIRQLIKRLPSYEQMFPDPISKIFQIAQYAEHEKLIDIIYTGYQAEKLFVPKTMPKDYEVIFINAFKQEIRRYLTPNADIRNNYLPIVSLREMLSKLLSGEAIIPEVGYGTPSRAEKVMMIKVGEIRNTSVLMPAAIYPKFKLINEIKEQEAIDLSRIFDFCIQEQVGIIQQPVAAVAEILDAEFVKLDSIKQIQILQLGKCEIDKPEIIRQTILDHSHHYIAVLDFLTAKNLEANIEQNQKGDVVSIHLLTYPKPLPTGFFVPRGDDLFLEHIWRTINSSYFDPKSQTWNKDFIKMMDDSLIKLDKAPSAIIYNEKEDTWEAAYKDLLDSITEALIQERDLELSGREDVFSAEAPIVNDVTLDIKDTIN